MRRFVSSLLVTAALLGAVGVCQYALTRRLDFSIINEPDTHGHAGHEAASHGAADYTLRATLGFRAGDDPFAVRMSAGDASARLTIRHGARELYATTDELIRGQTISIADLQFDGEAVTLFVEAVPGSEDAGNPCSLRLQMVRDGVVCGAETLWSEGGGARLSGEVQLGLVPELEALDRGLGKR